MRKTISNFESLREKDLSQYAGEWIAVVEDNIVEHGLSFKEVYEKVKLLYPKERPLIGKVPEKNLITYSVC